MLGPWSKSLSLARQGPYLQNITRGGSIRSTPCLVLLGHEINVIIQQIVNPLLPGSPSITGACRSSQNHSASFKDTGSSRIILISFRYFSQILALLCIYLFTQWCLSCNLENNCVGDPTVIRMRDAKNSPQASRLEAIDPTLIFCIERCSKKAVAQF